MNWYFAALLSAMIYGVTAILQNHLLSRRKIPSLQSYLIISGVITLAYGLLLLFLYPFPENTNSWALLAAVASALFRSAGVCLMFFALSKEEASQVIPVIQTSPVFVALLAIPLLGETLSYLQWLAIFVVVAGAILVSVKRSPSGSTTWLGKILILLFGISLLNALANTVAKYSLAYISSWNLFSLTSIFVAASWFAFTLRPRFLKDLQNIKQRTSTLTLAFITEILAVTAMALVLLAIEIGPVSLVSTIAGTRPVFVAIYSIILSRVLPRFLLWSGDKRIWTLRFIAIGMTVGGISAIYLI